MKKEIKFSWMYSLLIILPLAFFNLGLLFSKTNIEVIETIKIKEVETEVCEFTCNPADIPECEFSLAYRVLKDVKNIYGEYDLKKGDVYLHQSPFYYGDGFCSTEEEGMCYSLSIIFDKNLFEPIK